MYVTRPLSHYQRSPETLSSPPEGPNSGYLVIQDDESEPTCCFGLCKDRYLRGLPFPQNKNLTVRYTSGSGENKYVSRDEATLIPVLNQPLSSNLYYAIKPHGSHKGEAYACSREEDKSNCCFCTCINDVRSRPLDPTDIYQQFEIVPYVAACSTDGRFYAKSVAPDGFPPHFLRRKGWQIYTGRPRNYELGEALGTNHALRARLPEFNFPVHCKTSEAIVVGKWYCPFMFIKDQTMTLRDQMKKTMFYEMILEQQWEQIFACENDFNRGNVVTVDVAVQTEVAYVCEREAVWDGSGLGGGVVWFKRLDGVGEEASIGLSSLIVSRMKWEEERAGWVSSEKNQVKVSRTEDFEGIGGWSRFGCYTLVERFVLRRLDGSVALTYEFKHTHQIKSKWE
ncbi:hypothetical protein NMG60_11036110 [Bertholletia excelsa]